MSFRVAPAAAAAAILAPFGYAEPALQVMSSALDLIAAVGQTFGERPEAVRALPRPPDLAFVLCVFALLWGALWRGNVRWLGVLFFAASIQIYVRAPQPVVAFDSDAGAVFARVAEGGVSRWALMAASGRSTYARDRLGAMLGLAPPTLERLAPPETCTDALCSWSSAGQRLLFVRSAEGLRQAYVPNAIVIARRAAPATYAADCGLMALIDADDLANRGGGFVTPVDGALQLSRAHSPAVRRPWTPHARASDQE